MGFMNIAGSLSSCYVATGKRSAKLNSCNYYDNAVSNVW